MKKLIRIAFFLFIPIIAILPLLHQGYFSMHDRQHVVRLFLLDTGIKQGILYPRWVDGLGFGFGYPLFNFYPPLIYYVAKFFHFFGFNYIWSIKLMLILGFYLAYGGMFLLLKKLFKNSWVALLGATLYLYAPYHAVLVYVRGAFAEFYAYNLLPWVFLGFVKLDKQKQIWFFSLVLALLILAHPLIAFPFVLLFSLFFIFYWLLHDNKLQLFLYTFGAALLGLGLSAFFWLPSLWERQFTLVNKILITQLANYNLHFVYLRQLWHSAWGYGGSLYGLLDGMSFEIGKFSLVLSVISVIGAIFLWFKKKQDQFIIKLFPYLILTFTAIFLITFHSRFIWDHISYLWYLQFPWRFLVYVVFGLAVIGPVFLLFIKERKIKLTITLIIVIAILVFSYQYFQPEKYLSDKDELYLTKEQIQWEQSKTSFEFMYREVRTEVQPDNTTKLMIAKAGLPKGITQANKELRINERINKFNYKELEIKGENKTSLVFNVSYFPGWQVYLDGKKVSLKKTGNLQLITVTIPKGQHLIELKFENTLVRALSWIISGFSWLILVGLIMPELFLQKKKDKPSFAHQA